MVTPKIEKTSLLEFFYDHLAEDDWLDGVDLYQAGKVSRVEDFNGLLMCEVAGPGALRSEVRLKIHPQGRFIQWIECTCRKNRTTGSYCEHIAALMIHLDRERQDLISKLDAKMPLKPQGLQRRQVVRKAQTGDTDPLEKGAGAAQTILDHLKGGIQSISLIANGPVLRVRLEIKPGHLTHYDLSLDASAKFLMSHPDLKGATAEVRRLEVYDMPVQLGTRISQDERDERIVAERAIAIPTDKKEAELFFKYSASVPEGKKGSYRFVPLKEASKYVGQEFFFVPDKGYWPLDRSETHEGWHELPLSRSFVADEAATFLADGFSQYSAVGPVYLPEEMRELAVLDVPKLSEISIRDSKGGWFELDPSYSFGKETISMVDLLRQVRKKRRKYFKIGKGWIKIPDFISEHDWQLDADEKHIKVDPLGLMRLKAAVGDFDHFVGSKRLLNQIRSKFEFTPEAATPTLGHTNLSLRPYQGMGLRWLWWLRTNELHGLLADEMGLGKTHQAMALLSAIQTEKKNPRFLVICPTTVLDHWEDKIEEFAPNLKPHRYHGPKRQEGLLDDKTDPATAFTKIGPTIITSYGVLLRDIRYLGAVEWDVVILDEAHFVKNQDTATYRAACQLKSRTRLCLTGTPMENHLGELKNLFDFLVPGYLGSDDYFRKHFTQPLSQDGNPETEMALQRLIHPFKMRRTKEQVLPDLPAKVEDLRHCLLSDEQVALYQNILSMKALPLVQQLKTEGASIPYLHIFAVLTLLKQACDHPALVVEGGTFRDHESGKFELLKELLEEAIESGHKVVIYSQYVMMIEIIHQYLGDIGLDHVVLTGQTRNRGQVIERFQTTPDCKVFCGSLLAGGIGIDLTAANVVIHYDRWWNASKENQATDRVHRIGQHKNVQVMKLVTRGTLEEKIDKMIRSKHSLFQKFLDKDEEIFKTLTRDELIDLLQA